jgi:pimeloyl-ACP methyl ester carboxylesterase
VRLLYPTRSDEHTERFGPYEVSVAMDAPMEGDGLPLVVIALIGHSMGGYTVLALAGGRPTAGPHETADGQIRPVSVSPDPRVRALVLLAPACVWFWSDGALDDVVMPILMLTAEKDELASHLKVAFVQRVGDPVRLEHRVVPKAGHHAFQSPFPPQMARPHFPPSRDPEGFDRAAFQPILYADILSFLQDVL